MEARDKACCAGCGFRAMRRSATRELVEAEESVRSSGELDSLTSRDYGLLPLCFRMIWDLPAEIEACPAPQEPNIKRFSERVRRVLNSSRDCGGYREWSHGFNPKEHAEAEAREQREQVETERFKLMIKTQKQSAVIAAIVGLFAGAISGPLVEGCSRKRAMLRVNECLRGKRFSASDAETSNHRQGMTVGHDFN